MSSHPLPSHIQLFTSFLRLGITAFGGPSMVAYIRKVVVEQKHWLNEDTFRNGVALCQTIPGATAMQTTAYVGLRLRGVGGAAMSFIGFGLPAFLLMTTLAAVYAQTRSLPAVSAAFSGLQAIIVAIVANATISFGKTSLKHWKPVLIAGLAAALFGLGVNPLLVIVLAALGGLAVLDSRRPASRPEADSAGIAPTTKPLLFLLAAIAAGFLLLYLTQPGLFELAALMFRIDLFAFGGGFASVPLMYHEIVDARGWIAGSTFLDGIVLGQITPGPIVITATFVGYWLFGLAGSVVATVSMFLPSFILLVGLAPYFDRLRASPYFDKIIGGILCSFVGLLLTVTLRFAGNVQWDVPRLLLAGGALIALLRKVDILWVVLIGAIVSIVVF